MTANGLPSGPISAVSAGIMHDDEVERDRQRLGLSPRQQMLDKLWSYYRCDQYAARTVAWDGSRHLGMMERDAVALTGYVPPGFYVANPETLPIQFRRPSTPYHLCKVIVDRFTSLLFSQKRHPRISVVGDQTTEDFLNAVAEAGRLWPTMMQARAFGGATGTAVVGFKLLQGRPVFEVFDPRWCAPKFLDRSQLVLSQLDYRYIFVQEVRDGEGKWHEVEFWFRRVIDTQRDVIFKPVPVDQPNRPEWVPQVEVAHNLGFCPVAWIQNQASATDVDGDSDCVGVYELVEAIDRLNAQAEKGVLANCFARETPFVTDMGVRRFADFRDGDRVRVITHTGAVADAVVREYGRQALSTVTVQRGPTGRPVAVRATANHRWLLASGEETTKLSAGDRLLPAPSTFAAFDYASASDEERRWWCRGFIWGDGSTYTSEGRVIGCRARLCGDKAAYAARFEDCGFKVWTGPGGEPHVRTRTHGKELPDQEAPLALLRAFVRGFVDADASKSSGASRWGRIQVTGEASISFVRNVFPAVGLYISGEVDMTGTSTNYGPRSAVTVRFSLNENASAHPNSEWRVLAVEAGSVEDVWCLEVPGDRSFVLPFGFATGNCDPTVVLATDAQMGEVRKGSSNAIKIPAGSSATYMEMSGSGILAAKEKAEAYKDMALEVAQCVLEQPDGQKTATEVDRNYASMLAKADTLREQYGEMGVKRLLNMVLVAARRLTTPRIDSGAIVRQTFALPDKVTVDPKTRQATREPRRLGQGPYQVDLAWPAYFEPNVQDAQAAVTAAVAARGASLVDGMTAAKYVAAYFDVEDVHAMVEAARTESLGDQASLEQMALAGPKDEPGASGDADAGEPNVQQAALNGAQVSSLLELAQAVAGGTITAESAMAIIEVSFPVNRDQAFKIVGTLGGKHSAVAQAQAAEKAKQGGAGTPPAPEEGQ